MKTAGGAFVSRASRASAAAHAAAKSSAVTAGAARCQGGNFPFNEFSIDLAARDLRMLQQRSEKPEIGRHSCDLKLRKRLDHAGERQPAIIGVDNQLREQRVVVRRHLITGAKPGIDADAAARRLAPAADIPCCGQKAFVRVLGIDASLDGVALAP